MKTNLTQFMLGLILVSSPYLQAKAESTGTHGGDVIITPGALRLRDLIDPGVCRFRSGRSILTNEQRLMDILKSVQKVNPEFGYGLQNQITKIKWCFTTSLKKIDTNDVESESLTYYLGDSSQNKIQVGIRVLDSVFVDEKTLARIAPDDHPYFFIHEAMHGYIKKNAIGRNQKVRSMVKSIQDLFEGNINIEDFEISILGNEVQTLTSDDPIQPLLNVYYNNELTVSERIEIAKGFPSIKAQTSNKNFEEEIIKIKNYFSQNAYDHLFKRTGLARFQLMKNNISEFGWNVIFQRGDVFGKCAVTQNDYNRWSSVTGTSYAKFLLTETSTQKILETTPLISNDYNRPVEQYFVRLTPDNPVVRDQIFLNTIMYKTDCDSQVEE